jgi:hypothetical protein
LPTLFQVNSQIWTNEQGENFISHYQDKLTKEEIIKQTANIKCSFPSLPPEFYLLFSERIRDNKFTDKRLRDSVAHVIDTCVYPNPTIAQFLSFDKREKLFTRNEMLKIVNDGGIWNHYEKVEVKNETFWIKKNATQIITEKQNETKKKEQSQQYQPKTKEEGKHLTVDEAYKQGFISKWFYDLITDEGTKQLAKHNNKFKSIKDIVK